MTISDLKACISDMPAALMAVNSLLSPKLPKVISEDKRIARGRACGTSISPAYQKNWAMISIDKPLPTNSSTDLHKNCIISTNWQMKNVPTNSKPNCLAINMSNFLIRNMAATCFTQEHERMCKISIKISDILLFVFFYYSSFTL